MSEVSSNPSDFNLEVILDSVNGFEPFEWKSNSGLAAGSVVRVSHERNPNQYVFTCMSGDSGGNRGRGYLFHYHKTSSKSLELQGSYDAELTAVHPSAFLAQIHTPYLEFVIHETENTTRIKPVFDNVSKGHSLVLEQHAHQEALKSEHRELFLGDNAQRVVTGVVGFLVSNALGDERDQFLRSAAFLQDELIKPVE